MACNFIKKGRTAQSFFGEYCDICKNRFLLEYSLLIAVKFYFNRLVKEHVHLWSKELIIWRIRKLHKAQNKFPIFLSVQRLLSFFCFIFLRQTFIRFLKNWFCLAWKFPLLINNTIQEYKRSQHKKGTLILGVETPTAH